MRSGLQSTQARKSRENSYSFSILLWFALRHHFFAEKMMSYVILGNDRLCLFFDKKKYQKFLWFQIDFLIICNFFWSGVKQRFCFRESMSVFDQNGRIQALGFLDGGWQATPSITKFLTYKFIFSKGTVNNCKFRYQGI